MEGFRRHSAMFNGLLDTVSNDIVSWYFPLALNILEPLIRPRGVNDQVRVRH
jgi:hypothetical protein